MPSKSQMPWLLAVLVLTAYTHCVFSHAVEAVEQHHQLRGVDQPLDNSRTTCENESSCICKGATLAIDIQMPDPVSGLVHLVCLDCTANLFSAEPVDLQPSLGHGEFAYTRANLRAQLQRYSL